MACGAELVASFQELVSFSELKEAQSYEAACTSLLYSRQEAGQGLDHNVVASLPQVACQLGLVTCVQEVVSLPWEVYQLGLVACVLGVASLPWEV